MKGVVLAAGASRRAGGCKALFPYDASATWLDRAIETQRSAGVELLVVVVADPWEALIRGHLRDRRGVNVVHNARSDLGMLGSLRVGLSSMGPALGPTALSLIDHPEVRASTVRALLDRVVSIGPRCVARPRFEGRHGHPIVIGDHVAHDLSGREARLTLRGALERTGELHSVDVDDAAVLHDHDGPIAGRDQRATEAIAFAK